MRPPPASIAFNGTKAGKPSRPYSTGTARPTNLPPSRKINQASPLIPAGRRGFILRHHHPSTTSSSRTRSRSPTIEDVDIRLTDTPIEFGGIRAGNQNPHEEAIFLLRDLTRIREGTGQVATGVRSSVLRALVRSRENGMKISRSTYQFHATAHPRSFEIQSETCDQLNPNIKLPNQAKRTPVHVNAV